VKYAIVTFGCRVNQSDSLGFEESLLARGDVPARPEEADLVLVNTCSVTASADQSARQTIRKIARDNPAATIVATGCYATRRPDEVRALPHVSHVVLNDDKPRLIQVLKSRDAATCEEPVSDTPTTAERFGDGDGHCGSPLEPGVGGRTAYTLRVQTGCAERCSYCIIPTTRGRPRSLPPADVCRELRRVIDAGFKEVAITGVHLGSYGRDLTPASSLGVLLELLVAIAADGGARLRVSSLEPMDCTPAVVDLFTHAVVAPHFHLPLQHASARMLTAMRRPYTLEHYASVVEGIRARIPEAAIGSDIIVGFPGESDDDVERLTTYLAASPLTHLHVFPYSDRPGTAAAALPGVVAGPVVRARGRAVRAVGEQLSTRFRDGQIGTRHRALTIDDGTTAVTGNYLKVTLPAGRRRNEWITLRIAGTAERLVAADVASVDPSSGPDFDRGGQALSGRSLLALDDQLTAGGPDVAAAALAH
jgi:threonylcarbamoyladenosine tRNA methylthiotransferase MtaB